MIFLEDRKQIFNSGLWIINGSGSLGCEVEVIKVFRFYFN